VVDSALVTISVHLFFYHNLHPPSDRPFVRYERNGVLMLMLRVVLKRYPKPAVNAGGDGERSQSFED
jgi:hypothetical protein